MPRRTTESPRTHALDIGVQSYGGRHMLSLEGELDLQSQPRLQALLDALPTPTAILLDLTKVSFMDSAGLRAILSVQQRCEEAGIEFVLTPGTAQTQRLFEITGLLDRLPFSRAVRDGWESQAPAV